MATTSPTPNYDWVLPVPGGSIGAWGTILNKIFAEDTTPLGIDGVLKALADDIDSAEADITSLDGRVDTLEEAGTSAFYARLYRSSTQNIPRATLTKVVFDTESFDQGSMSSGGPSITVPSGAGGVYQIRAQVLVPFSTGSGDDARQWRMEIHKNGTKVAEAHTPYLNDGVDTGSSGNITLSASYLDASAVATDEYTVHVYQTFFGDFGTASASLQSGESNTFLEAVRLIAA